MQSHQCEFARLEVVKLLGSILAPVGLFALVLHGAAAANLLPRPLPALDADRTILLHQAEASRSQHDADLVLIGDSSCLMDVSAPQLSAALANGHRALNLGTLSYLDLSCYASLLQKYLAANPNRIRTVILLMHPEALRRAAPEEHHVEILKRYYAGLDYCEPSSSSVERGLGGAILKGRVLSRFLPIPLEGSYAQKYGFTAELWDYLSKHDGSAIDPRQFDRSKAQGNAEYYLSTRLESPSRAFRSAMPNKVKLMVGITPAPASYVAHDYDQRHHEMLAQWSHWLGAHDVLTDLPASMPDHLFASTTHLNESGQRQFTEGLARSLARQFSSETFDVGAEKR